MGKQYNIYGIGNALVDFEIETTADDLAALNVEKGVMTLIEEEQQNTLFKAFKGQHHSRACGGSAANTIIGAQSLGAKCFYSCRVANDETGQFYRDDLLSHGVDSNLANEALAEGHTGKCLVLITPDADRTMNTFLGITGEILFDQVNADALANSEYLYIEGYLASSPSALATVAKARAIASEKQVKIAVSLSDPNMVKFCREGLEQIIGDGVDTLFCNEDEAIMYTGTNDMAEAGQALLKVANTVIITLGPKGSLILQGDKAIEVSGNAVKAIDTNGAGDLFAGSFLYAVSHGHSLEKAGELASFASAQLVTQFGPRLSEEKLSIVREKAQQL